MTAIIDRERLAALKAREDAEFVARHPRSRALFERAQAHMLDGVPMNWMTRWSSPFPPFVAEAHGARFTCVDGHEYVDFCLGDTGAMTGHSPDGPGRRDRRPGRARHHHDAAHRGLALGGRRAGAPLRPAATGSSRSRPRTPTASPCVSLATSPGGRRSSCTTTATTAPWTRRSSPSTTACRGPKPGNAGPPVDPTVTTKVVEWNDLEALERALEPGDVACVLAEPALTNIGIILPDDGYHEALRRLTRETGTLLIIDETHTICAGPGGCTQAWGLRPGHGDPRQAHRQRRPGRGLRLRPGDRRPHPQRTGTTTPPTSAASAARWPATRSASRRCARP